MNEQQTNDNRDRLKNALVAVQNMRSQLEAQKLAQTEPIAIIGMGCRFPGDVNDPESFWNLLKNGVDAVSDIPPERWDMEELYDSNPDVPGKMYVRRLGLLKDVDKFDAQFFGISPDEAINMDPQHRLLLEVSWSALENAGQAPLKLKNSQTGVFVGITSTDYLQLQTQFGDKKNINAYSVNGNCLNTAAGRLSYLLGLQGPSMAVDTACSSSLVAIHLACQSLRSRECDQTIAGGVNLILSPYSTVATCKAKMLSTDGRCKTFDAAADGLARGEGCGIVVLKRLSDAIAAEDNILALIKGSAVNQDGASSSLTVPNGRSQQALIHQALANAQINPLEVSYIEAHGTGTALGDPIEMESLATVFCQGRPWQQPLYVGSAKTNLGHLESAAGVAGLIKLVLSLQKREIPPHLHFSEPTPHIRWNEIPVEVVTKLTPWKSAHNKLIAGLSSFGISGTNAHVIIEEAPKFQISSVDQERPLQILNLSAKSEEALQKLAKRFEKYLNSNPSISLADICFTANTGRSFFKHRLSLIADSTTQLQQQLKAFLSHQDSQNVYRGDIHNVSSPGVAFLFLEKRTECIEIGKQLYETQPTFRHTLNRCQEIVSSYLPEPLLSILYPDNESISIDKSIYIQPALFAIEYALYELIISWGIQPTSIMGYGIGEYVAATVAEVFSLEDGLKLAVARGHLMQMSANQDDDLISDSKLLNYQDIVTQINYLSPQISIVSSITGKPIREEIASPEYWLDHLTQSTNFTSGIVSLYQQQCRIFLEIGFSQGLGKQCLETLPQSEPTFWLSTLRSHSGGFASSPDRDWQQLLKCLAILFTQGIEIDWDSFDRDYPRRRVQLPTYPFQRKRYWFETEGVSVADSNWTPTLSLIHEQKIDQLVNQIEQAEILSLEQKQLLPQLLKALTKQHQQQLETETLTDFTYQLEWQHQPQDFSTDLIYPPGYWIVFATSGDQGKKIAEKIESRGQTALLVYANETFQQLESFAWTLNPTCPKDFESLFDSILQSSSLPCLGILHLWSINDQSADHHNLQKFEQALAKGCSSVLHLIQNLSTYEGFVELRLWLVTRGACTVGKSPNLSLEQSPLWGLGRVIAIEHPELFGGLIDLDPTKTPEEINWLLTEIDHPSAENQVAFRDQCRYVPRLVHSLLPKSQQRSLCKKEGTYLITGGLGALGFEVAQWMIGEGVKYLILLGRSSISEPTQRRLQELEQDGIQIITVQADVSSEEEINKVFKNIPASWPSLRGVIHAAGVLNDELLKEHNWSSFCQVTKPKIAGAWILHSLTKKRELDFFVCFSSATSLLGSRGQGSYAAANIFLDALAHYRRSLNLPGLSINWGPWTGIGMAADKMSWFTQLGIKGLATERAIEAMASLIEEKAVQKTVIDIDWSIFKSWYETIGGCPLIEKINVKSPLDPQSKTSQQSEILRQLQNAAEDNRVPLLLAYLQDCIAKTMTLERSQIEVSVHISDLGMDSLMTFELLNKLRRELAVEIDIMTFVNNATLINIATKLNQQIISAHDNI
jgi:acyl transferase domain-containing protein/acyl carrier protein